MALYDLAAIGSRSSIILSVRSEGRVISVSMSDILMHSVSALDSIGGPESSTCVVP